MQGMSFIENFYDPCAEPELEYSGMVNRFVEDVLKIQNFVEPKIMKRPGGYGCGYEPYKTDNLSAGKSSRLIIYAGGYLQARSILTEGNYPRWAQIGRSENHLYDSRHSLAKLMVQMDLQDWIFHTETRYNLTVAAHDFCTEMMKTRDNDEVRGAVKDVEDAISQIDKLMSALKVAKT